jgi:hypothetical protein
MKHIMGKLLYDEDACQGVTKVKVPEDIVGLDILSDWINELQSEYDRILHKGWMSN